MGMSHEMLIIRTVAKMLDLQKVIKIWLHWDITDESGKILRQNDVQTAEKKVRGVYTGMCVFCDCTYPLLTFSHLPFPFPFPFPFCHSLP